MNILFINTSTAFTPEEMWSLRAINEMMMRGHKIILCCRAGTRLALQASDMNIDVHEMSFRSDWDLFTIARLAILMTKNKIRIIFIKCELGPRIIHLASLCTGRKMAIVLHRNIEQRLQNHWKTYPVNSIIANSDEAKRSLIEETPWLQEEQIIVIYNGIDVEAFRALDPLKGRQHFGLGKNDFVIGFVGLLNERKGLGVLLSAFGMILRQVPRAKLLIAGIGPLQEMLESEARHKGWQDRIVLAGFVDEIGSVMSAIDIIVQPTPGPNSGNALMEAMAAQKPAIGTNIASIAEIIIPGETGYLINPGDSDQLAHFAVKMADAPESCRAMGEEALERASSIFSFTNAMNHLEIVLRRAGRTSA